MAFIYDLTDTWNAGGVTFNAIRMNVTDTASAAASRLVSLQVGGAERFGVDKGGNVLIGNGGDLLISSATGGNNSEIYNDAQDLYIATNGSTRFYISSSGNIGLGNTSPGALLDVTGNILLSGASPNIELNNGGPIIYSPAANALAFATGGGPTSPVERMRIDSSGNVGIGTTSISYKMEIGGDLRIAGGGGDLRIQSATGTTTSVGDSQIYNDANNIIFATGTTTAERFRIGSAGQFGLSGENYGNSGQVLASQGSGLAPTWLSMGVRSNGQNVISGSTTLGAADKGTNLLIVTSGITVTLPSSGYASGEGVAISNISGGSVTLSAPGGSDFGSTLPNDASFFAFCDGGGFWRQYCYSTSRL
jgi:hypothetical protein